MTMEIELSKRSRINDLWEETRGDEAARDLLFGEIEDELRENIEEELELAGEARQDEIRDEIREELVDDPPDELRAAVIKGLLEDPPSGFDEAYPPWKELHAKIKDDVREDLDDEMDDLRLTIEVLKKEITQLKGEEPATPPKPRGAKK